MIRDLFVTRVYEASLAATAGFEAFNADLLSACGMVAAEDRAGQAWCKANDYSGYTSYGTLDDLPRRATVFGDLKRRLDRHAATFVKSLNLICRAVG